MTTVTERVPRTRADKFAERRAELGEAALQTLATLGYARTSLREIAQNSEFSHGVLHYYFTDKVDLIVCSVRQYKARCVTRYDQVTLEAQSYPELLDGFVEALGRTLRDEAPMHRLWYDLRAQALFESAFRPDVLEIDKSLENMVWRVMSRFSELTGRPLPLPSWALYALFDGVFERYLMLHLAGEADAIERLKTDARTAIEALMGPAGPADAAERAATAAPAQAADATGSAEPAQAADAAGSAEPAQAADAAGSAGPTGASGTAAAAAATAAVESRARRG